MIKQTKLETVLYLIYLVESNKMIDRLYVVKRLFDLDRESEAETLLAMNDFEYIKLLEKIKK